MLDSSLAIIASLILSGIFVDAGLQKLKHHQHFKTLIADYQIIAAKYSGPVVWLLGALELLMGIAILLPLSRPAAALGLFLLLVFYAAAMLLNIIRGRSDIDCGCAGPAHKQSLNGGLIVRNLALALVAVAAILTTNDRALLWLDWVVIVLASGTGIMLYHIVNQLLNNRNLLANLRG